MPTVLAPAPPAVRYTEQEYLLRERDALEKSDFLNGEIIPMPGASLTHIRINRNLTRFLEPLLEEKGCEGLPSDMRAKVSFGNNVLYTYPDFIVVCGKPEFAPDEFYNLINPKAIIEILSPSTQTYDLTTKAELYRSIGTLDELIFINQYKPLVEQYIRKGAHHWDYYDFTALENKLSIAGCEITLAQIYQLVEFKP